MMNRRVLPFVVVAVLVMVFVFAKSWGSGKTEPSTRFEKILTVVAELLEQGHFSPKSSMMSFRKRFLRAILDK